VVSTNLQLPQYVGNVIVASVVKVFLVNGTSASVHLPARDARISVVNLDGVIAPRGNIRGFLSVYVIDTENPSPEHFASVCAFRLLFLVEPWLWAFVFRLVPAICEGRVG